MARVNVEDEIEADPRFLALASIAGDSDRALGMLVRFWRLAQKYWGDGKLVPPHLVKTCGWSAIIDVDLAEIRPDGVYARGAEQRFAWYRQHVGAARNGGKASAEARRKKFGSAIPKNATNRTGAEPAPNRNRTGAEPEPNALTPALTLSPGSYEPELTPNGVSVGVGTPTPPSPRDLAQVWNEHRRDPQPKVNLGALKPGAKRWTHAKARLADQPDLAYWREVVSRIAASDFCRGLRGWTASFDFLLRPDTHVKVLEGTYDNRETTDSGGIDWDAVGREDPVA